MTGNVYLIHAFINDLTAALQQLVDNVADGALVAGDGVRGDDDEITRADLDLAVIGVRHAGQRRHRLALRTGRREDDLLGRVFLELIQIDDQVIGDLDVAQLARNVHVIDHGTSGEGYLSAVLLGAVQDLLDTADIRSEGRDDDAAAARLHKEIVKAVGYLLFGRGITGTLGVGGIGKQREYALIAQLSKTAQVDHAACHRGVVDLEVAGVDDRTRGGMDRHAHRVGDAVVDMDQLDVKASELYMVARVLLDQLGGSRKAVFTQLVLDQTDGQRRAVDRHVDLGEQVRDTADMILMTVSDDHAADPVAVLLDVGIVGDDHIDAQHIAVGERHAAVEDDHVALALEHCHVLSDLVQTAEKGDADRGFPGCFLLGNSLLITLLGIRLDCGFEYGFLRGGFLHRLARRL